MAVLVAVTVTVLIIVKAIMILTIINSINANARTSYVASLHYHVDVFISILRFRKFIDIKSAGKIASKRAL